MKPNKTISIFLITAFILSAAGAFAFAQNSPTFDMLKDANGIPNYDNAAKNSGTPPPAVPGLNNETASTTIGAAITKPTTTVPAVTPPVPPKPTLLGKMVKDLVSNRTDYAVAGAAGALTGFFLAGCAVSALLPGLGIMVLFLLLFRNV